MMLLDVSRGLLRAAIRHHAMMYSNPVFIASTWSSHSAQSGIVWTGWRSMSYDLQPLLSGLWSHGPAHLQIPLRSNLGVYTLWEQGLEIRDS